jgi:aminomethyltransferase
MFDMSPLKKVVVRGPDARVVLDHATTRDLTRVTPGKAVYLSVLTDGRVAYINRPPASPARFNRS